MGGIEGTLRTKGSARRERQEKKGRRWMGGRTKTERTKGVRTREGHEERTKEVKGSRGHGERELGDVERVFVKKTTGSLRAGIR